MSLGLYLIGFLIDRHGGLYVVHVGANASVIRDLPNTAQMGNRAEHFAARQARAAHAVADIAAYH